MDPLNSNSWDDLAQAYIKLVVDYTDCAMRYDTVVELWGRFIF